MAESSGQARYFITKCYNIESLKKCLKTSRWACRERTSKPQTWTILTQAFHQGKVLLIFSVNNCHGYHGYASVSEPPTSEAEEDGVFGGRWHHFRLTWHTVFLASHGHNCLSFAHTHTFTCLDQVTPVNKARNMQEVCCHTGAAICQLIDTEYERLNEVVASRQALKQPPKPFLDFTESPSKHSLWNDVLQAILLKVEKMGEVILACPFGSQRYNCHTEDSDVDMFIVYQAPTSSVLGFKQPLTVIKNTQTEQFDYTIFELFRFLELLLGGDPRCVECLFLHESMVYRSSPQYEYLCGLKEHFLSRQCVDKYLNDAGGAKGLRLMNKWLKSGDASESPMPHRVGKLFYIIIRLLQNAKEIVESKELRVYREESSVNRKLLMAARHCQLTYEEARKLVDSLFSEVDALKETCLTEDSSKLHVDIEQFLLKTRFDSFKVEMKSTD